MAEEYTPPFLRLPPELRNWIYELAIEGDQHVSITKVKTGTAYNLQPRRRDAIRFTNRQIREECAGIWYSTRIFTAWRY
jgi:hypothetical protein